MRPARLFRGRVAEEARDCSGIVGRRRAAREDAAAAGAGGEPEMSYWMPPKGKARRQSNEQ